MSLLVLSACAPTTDTRQTPEYLLDLALYNGLPATRFWGDERPLNHAQLVADFRTQRRASRLNAKPTLDILAVSGGADRASFAVGFLSGWQRNGTLPAFDVVTGYSSGALIALFAFLGPRYEAQMVEAFTQYRRGDIVKFKPSNLIGERSSAFNERVLRRTIERYLDDALVAELARQHNKGRRLYIGTTHLSAARPVIWDLGSIAVGNAANRRAFIIDVLLASTSLPAIFPPVKFAPQIGGQRWLEFHVDGGITTGMFAHVGALELDHSSPKTRPQSKQQQRIFMLRTGVIRRAFEARRPNVSRVASRSLTTVMHRATLGDFYRIHHLASFQGDEVYLAAIPQDFQLPANRTFDPALAVSLYQLGYNEAVHGYKWLRSVPTLGDNPNPFAQSRSLKGAN